MKIEKFEELLDQYGWDVSSWPELYRYEANSFIALNDEAAELLRSLKSVEDFLADDPLPMGKHQAIDDIFAAIDVNEGCADRAATGNADIVDIKSDIFAFSDDRPKHHRVTVAAKQSDDVIAPRQTYPSDQAATPAQNAAVPTDSAHSVSSLTVKSSRALLRYSATFASAFGMVICVMFGFVVGVIFTSEQEIQSDVQATELPMVRALENHFFDEASQGMGLGNNVDKSLAGQK
ncbi:hypothetical protein [Thalassospira alkalitolerans]|uniref:hypothetical protein n=1 Tax=Thalassospira alkalitolerans TaxID=1293890 RepID=UPI0030EE912B